MQKSGCITKAQGVKKENRSFNRREQVEGLQVIELGPQVIGLGPQVIGLGQKIIELGQQVIELG